jgi:serine phosphatase RsbU (regulator of sigma subunit)
MSDELKILLVEDSESDADLLIRFLRKHELQFSYTRVWNKQGFLNGIKSRNLDIIIADNSLPQFSGMEAFRILRKDNINIPFILVTGTVTENVLIEYAKEGIDDYIFKDNLLRLPSAIEHVISKKKIEHLHAELSKAYMQIKDSINYSKTIQNAMLPDPKMLSSCFPESFIFFKPRDVLSGDFYWFKEEDTTFYVAAADCTGHGVPGALLSMIGIEKLGNIALDFKEPEQILSQLNERITNAFSLSTHLGYSDDGMDIALCSINKLEKKLYFSGANRPLWIIRNGQTGIEVVKGTQNAVGGRKRFNTNKFTCHLIYLNQGDTIYLFSDGYADTFGGLKNEKLKIAGFKNLLISIQSQTMSQQKESLTNFIEDWKGFQKQIDDMLIIGIRVDF